MQTKFHHHLQGLGGCYNGDTLMIITELCPQLQRKGSRISLGKTIELCQFFNSLKYLVSYMYLLLSMESGRTDELVKNRCWNLKNQIQIICFQFFFYLINSSFSFSFSLTCFDLVHVCFHIIYYF